MFKLALLTIFATLALCRLPKYEWVNLGWNVDGTEITGSLCATNSRVPNHLYFYFKSRDNTQKVQPTSVEELQKTDYAEKFRDCRLVTFQNPDENVSQVLVKKRFFFFFRKTILGWTDVHNGDLQEKSRKPKMTPIIEEIDYDNDVVQDGMTQTEGVDAQDLTYLNGEIVPYTEDEETLPAQEEVSNEDQEDAQVASADLTASEQNEEEIAPLDNEEEGFADVEDNDQPDNDHLEEQNPEDEQNPEEEPEVDADVDEDDDQEIDDIESSEEGEAEVEQEDDQVNEQEVNQEVEDEPNQEDVDVEEPVVVPQEQAQTVRERGSELKSHPLDDIEEFTYDDDEEEEQEEKPLTSHQIDFDDDEDDEDTQDLENAKDYENEEQDASVERPSFVKKHNSQSANEEVHHARVSGNHYQTF